MLRKVYEGYFSVGYLTTIMALPLHTLLLSDYGVSHLVRLKHQKKHFVPSLHKCSRYIHSSSTALTMF